VAFDHVFFDAARRGDADADARAALARLASGADPAAEAGDPFLAPRHQPLASEVSLARYFGPEFASALFGLAAGRWSGPLASIGGVHLVRIERHEPARVPTLEEVRPQVRDALLTEEAEAAVRRFLELRRTP
jgi:parvulin-like peptidyl-prolyl isomerase